MKGPYPLLIFLTTTATALILLNCIGSGEAFYLKGDIFPFFQHYISHFTQKMATKTCQNCQNWNDIATWCTAVHYGLVEDAEPVILIPVELPVFERGRPFPKMLHSEEYILDLHLKEYVYDTPKFQMWCFWIVWTEWTQIRHATRSVQISSLLAYRLQSYVQ